jgi:hypothetical protein
MTEDTTIIIIALGLLGATTLAAIAALAYVVAKLGPTKLEPLHVETLHVHEDPPPSNDPLDVNDPVLTPSPVDDGTEHVQASGESMTAGIVVTGDGAQATQAFMAGLSDGLNPPPRA